MFQKGSNNQTIWVPKQEEDQPVSVHYHHSGDKHTVTKVGQDGTSKQSVHNTAKEAYSQQGHGPNRFDKNSTEDPEVV